MNLEQITRKRKASRKNNKRFFTSLDMSIIKKDAATRNSRIKRGETTRGGTEYIAECGCGVEGCFIHHGYNKKDT